MKKLLLLCVAVVAFSAVAQSQIPVNDTLRYFLYKQRYKLPPVTGTTSHPFYKSKAAVFTNTFITHVGSKFKNKDANLMVYGLEARVLIPNLVTTGPQLGGVPFRLYLCNINPTTGMPVFPPVDSVFTKVLSTASNTFLANYGAYTGGTFTAGPRPITGDFAVLARCVSTYDGDTIKIFRTAGHTATSTTAPTNAHKFGEGMGLVRKGGIFYPTTNFNDPSFGNGTDYEFCVAPMVSFTLNVNQIESPTQEGACEWEVFTNTNTSSPEFTNKQFNFNEFSRILRPFDPQSEIVTSFVQDSVFAWDMGDGQQPYYQPPGIDSIHIAYASGICNQFFTGNVTGKYKQAAYNINAQTIVATLVFTASCVWCNDSAGSSINEKGPLSRLKIFPNPTISKTAITGLKGSNNISIYNMIGQLLYTETSTEEIAIVDLSKHPQGTYLIRITDAQSNTRMVKVVRQ